MIITLNDLRISLLQIKEAISQIQVEGRNNAALVVFCWDKCDELIGAVNEASCELNQNGKEGDTFEQDSGSS